jgi:hypothetical protein
MYALIYEGVVIPNIRVGQPLFARHTTYVL